MLHDHDGVVYSSGAVDALSVDIGDTSSVLVGAVTVCDFVSSGVTDAMSELM